MSDLYTPSLTHPRTPALKLNVISHVLSGTTPEQVTNERKTARAFNVSGFKDETTANSGSVYVGLTPTDQQWEVPAGGTTTVQSEEDGLPIAANDIWARGSSGDGVRITHADGYKV